MDKKPNWIIRKMIPLDLEHFEISCGKSAFGDFFRDLFNDRPGKMGELIFFFLILLSIYLAWTITPAAKSLYFVIVFISIFLLSLFILYLLMQHVLKRIFRLIFKKERSRRRNEERIKKLSLSIEQIKNGHLSKESVARMYAMTSSEYDEIDEAIFYTLCEKINLVKFTEEDVKGLRDVFEKMDSRGLAIFNKKILDGMIEIGCIEKMQNNLEKIKKHKHSLSNLLSENISIINGGFRGK